MPGISDSTPSETASANAPNPPIRGDESAIINAESNLANDKYEPPNRGIRELTQTDRLNKQLLESLLNRMQAAAQSATNEDLTTSSKEDNTTTPRNSIDWE